MLTDFVDVEFVRDTKVYRLHTDRQFVFVFSTGKTAPLSPGPRTGWVGHVSPDDKVTLTDLNMLLKKIQGQKDWDVADPHVYMTAYDANHIWLSWTCGADTKMCAIRSETRGVTFNADTFGKWDSSVHPTVHEPSITCNSANDCLLGWGETINWKSFDLLVARWTSNGWCSQAKHLGGDDRGIPLEMPQAIGANAFRLPTLAGSPDGGAGVLHYLDNTFATPTACAGAASNDQSIESDYVPGVAGGNAISYDGVAANIAPRHKIAGVPSWLMYSHGLATDEHAVQMKAVRLDDAGSIDATELFADPEEHVYVLAGNVDYDGQRFYAFYHKFYASDHAANPDTYSICYRTTADALSDTWGAEQCPVEHLPVRPEDTLGNVIQPVGSAWQGQISIIYQKDCHFDAEKSAALCTVALKRYD